MQIEADYERLATGDISILNIKVNYVDFHPDLRDSIEDFAISYIEANEKNRAFDESVDNYIDMRRNK